MKENEGEKREENPNEKWLGDTNIFGSFLTAETFHIYSSGALMYLQPVFRAFVPVKERSGRGGALITMDGRGLSRLLHPSSFILGSEQKMIRTSRDKLS